MRHLTLALLPGSSVGCSGDPVDRDLVGTWQTAVTSPVGAWQLRFTALSNSLGDAHSIALGRLALTTL